MCTAYLRLQPDWVFNEFKIRLEKGFSWQDLFTSSGCSCLFFCILLRGYVLIKGPQTAEPVTLAYTQFGLKHPHGVYAMAKGLKVS